jgi:hypothetical protein
VNSCMPQIKAITQTQPKTVNFPAFLDDIRFLP